jgi:hypothetical protein
MPMPMNWTQTRRGEMTVTIGYEANLVAPAAACLRLYYTSTTRATGASYSRGSQSPQPHSLTACIPGEESHRRILVQHGAIREINRIPVELLYPVLYGGIWSRQKARADTVRCRTQPKIYTRGLDLVILNVRVGKKFALPDEMGNRLRREGPLPEACLIPVGCVGSIWITPPHYATMQVAFGEALMFATSILIGSS